MSDKLFRLQNVTLPGNAAENSSVSRERQIAELSSAHNQGTDVPRSPETILWEARLRSVTLAIPRGATAIVGLSGAGKTSLLNVLAGFETGFAGAMTSSVSENSGDRLPLFWVPQSGGLWPHLSTEQHLEVVSPSAKSGQISKRTDEILNLFDLTHRRRAIPAELSQGERARLALARALASQAAVLLLDEPLSHVDPVRKPKYWNIVRQMVAEENISMIFTSHEPETVLRQAEHVICLHAGSTVFEGSVRSLYDNPPNAQVGAFLGPLNWFRAEEAALFLRGQVNGTLSSAVRPERMHVYATDDAEIELMATPFVGTYQESIVRHVASGITKSVLHQVPEVAIPFGQRITFRIRPQSGATS